MVIRDGQTGLPWGCLVGAFSMIVKTDGSFAALPVALVTIMTSDPDIHVEGVVPAALVV